MFFAISSFFPLFSQLNAISASISGSDGLRLSRRLKYVVMSLYWG